MDKAVKNMHGNWECCKTVSLGSVHQLKIVTTKRSNGTLVTTVSVGRREGAFIYHRAFTDFHNTLKTTSPKRITSGAVEAQHDECMSKLSELKEAVLAHYVAIGEPVAA